jgi:hypothetical protein
MAMLMKRKDVEVLAVSIQDIQNALIDKPYFDPATKLLCSLPPVPRRVFLA